ncbi:MAG: hypothetical protein AAGG01_11080 [Planctomycetota bacterium]
MTFWAGSELVGSNFQHQRVYSNQAVAAPFTGDVSQISWAPWGDAQRISAPGEDHNSWPFSTQLPDGSGVFIWWSAATIEGIFADEVDQYWLATWDPLTGWSQAVDVTPPGEAGTLSPITETDIALDRNGDPHLVVFTKSSVSGTSPVLYVPGARTLDLSSIGGLADWEAPVFATALGGAAGYAIPSELTFDDYVNRPYRNQLNDARRNTPRAIPVGSNGFLSSWLDESLGGAVPIVSTFRVVFDAAQPTLQWEPPVSLLSLVTGSGGNGSADRVNLTVDRTGWGTLFFRQEDDTGDLEQLFSKRANIATAGLSAFALGEPASVVNPVGTSVINYSLSNTLDSGVMGVSMDLGPGGSSDVISVTSLLR